jgi:hypothetical protein
MRLSQSGVQVLLLLLSLLAFVAGVLLLLVLVVGAITGSAATDSGERIVPAGTALAGCPSRRAAAAASAAAGGLGGLAGPARAAAAAASDACRWKAAGKGGRRLRRHTNISAAHSQR